MDIYLKDSYVDSKIDAFINTLFIVIVSIRHLYAIYLP